MREPDAGFFGAPGNLSEAVVLFAINAHSMDFFHLLTQPALRGGVALACFLILLDRGGRWVVYLVQVCQFLTAGTMFVEDAIATVSKVVAAAVVALRDANFARTMLACFAELLVVLIIVGLAAFFTP